MTAPMPAFPASFRWGVSTAAYQIEGAVGEDGRGPSIWDTFTHEPGRVADISTGDVACDHYHRYMADVELMAALGVGAYRFSVAWPRVQPTGAGPANPAGVAFYDRLVDALLERGIDPVATLFHWDLPQALQDDGGWANRDTAARFGEYADLVAEALGNRVKLWITLNEPFVHTNVGHVQGRHAPGLRLGRNTLPIIHHQLLGHGLAVSAIRRHSTSPVAIANAYSPVWPVGPDGTPATATDADRRAAAVHDTVQNRMYTDPPLLGRYPDGYELMSAEDVSSIVLDGDLAVIGTPLDALGVNYYVPVGVSAAPDGHELSYLQVPLQGFPLTGFGWPVVPDGLRQLLVGLRERYAATLPPIWITENGCAYPDQPAADGSIVDNERISYLETHVRAMHEAMAAGVHVRGYCVWSLLDNFEWAEGFTQRFGLVHVDFDTQQRTPKASYGWYRDLITRGDAA
jgi:beta-glucosidase